MQDINGYERFIGLLPGCYSMGVSHPETFVAGANLVLNSAEAPLTALTLYGHSTQDGTPSPGNPVPIVSTGSVMTTGAQLFKDYSVKIPVTPSTTYYVSSGQRTEPGRIDIGCYDSNQQLINADGLIDMPVSIYLQSSGLYRLSSDSDSLSFKITTGENTSFLAFIIPSFQIDGFPSLMLNAGDTPLPWEPYTGGQPAANPYEGEINVTISDGGTQSQFLTVSAPGGLPGIPVDASKLPEGMTPTYVDESGQQWICDEVDFSRGTYVKRDNMKTFDGSKDEFWSAYMTPGFEGFAINILDMLVTERGPGLSNLFLIGGVDGQPRIRLGANNNRMYMNNTNPDIATTVDEWLSWLSNNPLRVLYVLETPIETDLSDEEMAAYKALHTYSPTATVSNDAEAWMKVGYYSNAALEKMSREALKINGGNLK